MKKIFRTLLIAIVSIVGVTSVSALDMSNAKYAFVEPDDTDIRNTIYYDFVVTGTFDTSNTYSIYFSHDSGENVTTVSAFKKATVTSTTLTLSGLTDEVISALEKNGDIYVWVKENDTIVASAVKVERPELLLNRRFATQFQYEQTQIISRYPGFDNYSGRTVKYIIGRITDMDLVRSLNTTDASAKKVALNNLYKYATSKTNLYQEGTLTIGTSSSITRYMLDLVDGAYYYVYLAYTDGTGTYYSFDGVEIYQALNCSLNPNFNDPDMPEFTWPEEDKYYCEIVDNKYYDAQGNETDEATYRKDCLNESEKVCKIENDTYYGIDGEEVDKETYEKECTTVTLKCEIKDGTYYDKDGNIVSKEDYDKICGTTENPNTGVNFGLGITFIAIIFGTGLYTVIKKKNKFPQA